MRRPPALLLFAWARNCLPVRARAAAGKLSMLRSRRDNPKPAASLSLSSHLLIVGALDALTKFILTIAPRTNCVCQHLRLALSLFPDLLASPLAVQRHRTTSSPLEPVVALPPLPSPWLAASVAPSLLLVMNSWSWYAPCVVWHFNSVSTVLRVGFCRCAAARSAAGPLCSWL
jgi:hypothetical protein